ncbi:MAG TPA: hypothetical protein VLU25_13830 [Acidobacteriota bacterium]|nr:hypothetical protein [Acidobacteriota bacterium]
MTILDSSGPTHSHRVWLLLAALLIGSATASCQASLPAPQALDDDAFQQVSSRLSESPGYFDTDNLISNETSYQHALSGLPRGAGEGRAYLGVGPGQNFTYIAHLRPHTAIILDVRRDNQLFHLYWKELFRRSANRVEFLSHALARPLEPRSRPPGSEADAASLVRFFHHLPPDEEFYRQQLESIFDSLRSRFPKLVEKADKGALRRLSLPFARQGLSLRFASHGRRPRSFYPTYGQLILASDLEGRRGHFLEREEDYRFLKKMQDENRIIPVVGDFSGPHALKAVGSYLSRHDLKVTAFYLSNVEFYLFINGVFDEFAQNLEALPVDENSFLIRTHFGNAGIHAEARPGHFVTCLLQSASSFLRHHRREPYRSYWDLVNRDYIPLSTQSRE